ncbi:MAG: N-6 DNA methylase, partial [Methanocalculaceae archaeon]|nr:N-6 DNA methylase [Methanocalculaceae archaeon]
MAKSHLFMVDILDMENVKKKARTFASKFANEKGENEYYQNFYDELLEIFGVSRKKIVGARYQRSVRIRGKKKPEQIDFFWPSVLLIKNKSHHRNLKEAYEQSERYYNALDEELKPQYIIVTDFEEIHLYKGSCKDTIAKFKLENLESHVECLMFIAKMDAVNVPVSEDAADTLSFFYEMLRDAKNDEKKLIKYLMRLVFCMFADDTGIFGGIDDRAFLRFIKEETREDGGDLGSRLHWLFGWLNTPNERRQEKRDIDQKYHVFPYVNSGLFDLDSDQDPSDSIDFDKETREILISCTLADWKNVSPGIFGTLLQERMDKYERQQMGAHYTSEKCIHRVIDPLFLNDLKEEFNNIGANLKKLDVFHEKITRLKILDPACGCGNFLVVAYTAIRDLEIEILKKKLKISLKGKKIRAVKNQVFLNYLRDRRVSIQQFHGIEIQPFPSEIAKIAMILIEHKKNMEVSKLAGKTYMHIPTERYENIKCEDALETSWEQNCDYIIGNPPFVAPKKGGNPGIIATQRKQRKKRSIYGHANYVCCWFHDAARYCQIPSKISPETKCAFVSINSIVEGEHSTKFLAPLLKKVAIDFAYPSFAWSGTAKTNVVVIGFSRSARNREHEPRLYATNTDRYVETRYINHLLEPDGDEYAKKVINKKRYPKIRQGCALLDGEIVDNVFKHYYQFNFEEYREYVRKWGNTHVREIVNGEDIINGTNHYVLDLKGVPDEELNHEENIRSKKVAEIRKNGGNCAKKLSDGDLVKEFHHDTCRPKSDYLAIPRTFTLKHDKIPMRFISKDTLCTDKVLYIENPSKKLENILRSDEFYTYIKKQSNKMGKNGIGLNFELYYDYLDMISYAEDDED